MTCSTVDNETYIRVQTNGFPNHCYHAINANPVSLHLDFSVKFNMDMTGITNYSAEDIDSVDKTSELICDLQRTSTTNMLSDLEYTDNNSPPPGPV